MSEEFPTLPDFGAILQQRLATKAAGPLPPPGTVDPYKLMLQRKTGETAPVDAASIQKWPDEDVKALEDYCKKMGIVGFATRQNPRLALMQLKRQFGDDFTGVPLEERVPAGYEKLGTPSNTYSPQNRYGDSMTKKQVLHG